jgi:F420-dependent oxidoreductase-like protein
MKIALGLGSPHAQGLQWEDRFMYALEAERLGVESIWSAESWSYDAVTPLAYLAAKTSRILLGAGILQIGSRTPAMMAMTALSMASLSHQRFILGLGVSGPQVMEGWHGVHFAHPLQRTRETIEIIRMIVRGERLSYAGEIYRLPLPGGKGKALIPDAQACPNLPIYLAALGPKNLELTGELADGWLGTAFLPEHTRMFLDPIEAGAKRAGRSLADLEIQVSAGVVSFSDNLERLILPRKPGLAFTLGAMGSRKQNFYNEAIQRAGYAELALRVQDLWLNHQREAATALIPDDLVLKTNLLGTKERVRERLRIYRDGGVKTISVTPDGQTIEERLVVLGQLIELVNEINAETAGPGSPGSDFS